MLTRCTFVEVRNERDSSLQFSEGPLDKLLLFVLRSHSGPECAQMSRMLPEQYFPLSVDYSLSREWYINSELRAVLCCKRKRSGQTTSGNNNKGKNQPHLVLLSGVESASDKSFPKCVILVLLYLGCVWPR